MNRRKYCAIGISSLVAGCSEISGPTTSSSEEPNPDDSSQAGRTPTSSEGELTLNEGYLTESGISLSVDRFEIVTSDSGVTLGQDVPLVSKEGGFVLPHLTAENTSSSTVDVPPADRFSVAVEGESQDSYQEDFKQDPDGLESSVSEPVAGPLFPEEDTLSPGGQTDGWLVFGAFVGAGQGSLQFDNSMGERLAEWVLPLSA